MRQEMLSLAGLYAVARMFDTKFGVNRHLGSAPVLSGRSENMHVYNAVIQVHVNETAS